MASRYCFLNNHVHFHVIKGSQTRIGMPRIPKIMKKRKISGHTSLCYASPGAFLDAELTQIDSNFLDKIVNMHKPAQNLTASFMEGLVLADINPATAKLAIGILGPALSAMGFLFVLRIVMSWYPNLPVEKFPYVLAYAPTEPILALTRKVIPPLGGVDVTPVVWFGLVSFLNEILVGPQGLLVLLSQQV